MNEVKTKENSTITEKIQRASNFFKVVFKIAQVACCVGACICAVGIIYTMLFGNMDLMILNGKVILKSPFSADFLAGHDGWQLVAFEVAMMVSLILSSVLFKTAGAIFTDMSVAPTPFNMENVARIKKISILYLVVAILDIEKTMTSSSITLNMMGIIGAVMFWCIALIFEYGCELQKQSDETL